jgi:hypothetical protein
MIVFILGIIVLLFVFWEAFSMFTSPAAELLPASASSNATAAGLGSSLALMIVRIGLLFVMTLAGSLIASRGILLYLGGKGRIPVARGVDDVDRGE